MTGENKEFAYLAVFFLLGVDVAAHHVQWTAILQTRVVRLLSGAAALVLVSLPLWNPASGWYNPHLIPVVAVALLGLWHELSTRKHVPRARVLEAVGRDSIVYYVVHWPVIVVVGAAIQSLGWSAPLSLTAGLTAAFGVSATLAHFRHRNALVAALFAWPTRQGRLRPTESSAPAAGVRL